MMTHSVTKAKARGGSEPAINRPAKSIDATRPPYRAWKCGRAWAPSFQYIHIVMP